MLHDHHGNLPDTGRRHRRPTPALRRAVRERDRSQFPGCNSRRTDIHHIIDGQPLPNAPDLPGSNGDLTTCHDADITTDTIIPDGLADKFNLDLAIWAAFANARLDREFSQQQHEQQLAA